MPSRAFIPPPLPPAIHYDAELVKAVGESNRRLGELSGLARQLPNPQLLIRPFVRREAVLSSRIEGTEADVAHLYAFEAGQRSLPGFAREVPETDVREVVNYVRAMDRGLQRLESLPIGSRLLRELHEVLMLRVRGQHRAPGEFRKVQNWIGPPGCTQEEASFVPPPPQEVPELLGQLERYLHEPDPDHPPLVRLALVHYQFEAIHPFLDGNGRIGRLLVSLLLVHWDLLPLPLLYLSAYFERQRQEYYDRLLAVSTQGDWHAWILYFLRGVGVQALSAALLVKKLQDLQQEWRQRLSKPGVSTLATDLMESLFEQPILSIPMAKDRLQITYPSAKNHVDRLCEVGILSPIWDSSNPKLFMAGEILRLTELADSEPAESSQTPVVTGS